eukprot:3513270-Amphidinium_carterae.1
MKGKTHKKESKGGNKPREKGAKRMERSKSVPRKRPKESDKGRRAKTSARKGATRGSKRAPNIFVAGQRVAGDNASKGNVDVDIPVQLCKGSDPCGHTRKV